LVGWLLVLFCAGSCKRSGEEAEPSTPARHVKCAEVQRATLTDRIELRGTVAPVPDRDSQLAPQVAGRLLAVDVREGDEVKVGQVVARVDDAPLVDAARQADAAVERAKAEAENAQTTYARAKRVFEHGIAARQEVDDAAAKETAARAAAAEAEAAAHQAHRQIERAQLRSPMQGVVLKVLKRPGELVDGTPATVVVEVADLSSLELSASVPAQDLVRLQRGARATVTFSAIAGLTLEAEVARVSPSVDRQSGMGAVRVALHEGTARPPVGVLGTAQVEVGEARDAWVVPAAALRNAAAGHAEVVVCGADAHAHVAKVTAAAAGPGQVEVQGLDAGVFVAVEPVLGIADGDALEVEQ
jgi:RND family efflux transporter MFP subunit